MTTTQKAQISKALDAVIRQGQDPQAFRAGLADAYGVSVVELDEISALAGPKQVDPEDVAQERLRQDRIEARMYREEHARYEHEEA